MSAITPPTAASPPKGLTRLVAFARDDEGRPALLGFLGAALIAIGGVGAGSTRQRDPLLESAHLSWLRFGHGVVVSSILLWLGVGLILAAWLWLGRRLIDGRGVSEYTLIASTGFWLAPLMCSVPLFSRDAYSYLAQGALLRDGFDPYSVGPIENPNPLLDDVSSVWTTTPAPYGPAFILIAKFVTLIAGDNVVPGTILLRLCMLPGLALLIWAAPRVARHVGASGAVALWICVLNPLVIVHLMGGVHNEMLMIGLMMAGIALTLSRHHISGAALIAVAVAIKATAMLALPFMVWVWMRHLPGNRLRAFAVASAASITTLGVVFAVLSGLAGVGLGWLTALAGSARVINWLTIPTAVANLANAIGGAFLPVSFYGVLDATRLIGMVVIAITLPLLWWRFRHTDREALQGIAWAMVVVVLFAPAALPWYYTWPLAVASALVQSRPAIALIAGFSTWIMVIFKPDGAHGMYSWLHVLLATACAVAAWSWIHRETPWRPQSRPRSAVQNPID
ncbi:MAG: alpha-(1-_6)-mannopyranosyltransferase A [Mycobacterium sp.]|jgi:alpha-1,6-mannosyltransferase|nr:alpha-(1->6)-mannopyranosyltransferase A [Mycobacterium sp.]